MVATEANSFDSCNIHGKLVDIAIVQRPVIVYDGIADMVICIFQRYRAGHRCRFSCESRRRNETYDAHDSEKHRYNTGAKRCRSLHYAYHSFLLSKYTSCHITLN